MLERMYHDRHRQINENVTITNEFHKISNQNNALAELMKEQISHQKAAADASNVQSNAIIEALGRLIASVDAKNSKENTSTAPKLNDADNDANKPVEEIKTA